MDSPHVSKGRGESRNLLKSLLVEHCTLSGILNVFLMRRPNCLNFLSLVFAIRCHSRYFDKSTIGLMTATRLDCSADTPFVDLKRHPTFRSTLYRKFTLFSAKRTLSGATHFLRLRERADEVSTVRDHVFCHLGLFVRKRSMKSCPRAALSLSHSLHFSPSFSPICSYSLCTNHDEGSFDLLPTPSPPPQCSTTVPPSFSLRLSLPFV